MARLPHSPAARQIAVTCNAFHEPRRFTWGRTLFLVEQITDAWRVDTDWWCGHPAISRHYFSVTTTAGALFVIYYDLVELKWSLEQVYD